MPRRSARWSATRLPMSLRVSSTSSLIDSTAAVALVQAFPRKLPMPSQRSLPLLVGVGLTSPSRSKRFLPSPEVLNWTMSVFGCLECSV